MGGIELPQTIKQIANPFPPCFILFVCCCCFFVQSIAVITVFYFIVYHSLYIIVAFLLIQTIAVIAGHFLTIAVISYSFLGWMEMPFSQSGGTASQARWHCLGVVSARYCQVWCQVG